MAATINFSTKSDQTLTYFNKANKIKTEKMRF